MKQFYAFLVRVVLLVVVWLIWWWASITKFSDLLDLVIIVGGVVLVFPLVWIARLVLDRNPTTNRAAWMTTFVHYTLGILFGVPLIRAMLTHRDWAGWVLPIPVEIGLMLVIITGTFTLMTVANLALKGFGAPFAIALSRKLAVDWMYAWTRNPMVLNALALLLALGIWYQSALFVLWALFVVTPALLFFVKVFEERELEIRFGASYLEYKARTPMLFPRRPGR